jgi:hypothetical protein
MLHQDEGALCQGEADAERSGGSHYRGQASLLPECRPDTGFLRRRAPAGIGCGQGGPAAPGLVRVKRMSAVKAAEIGKIIHPEMRITKNKNP